MGRNGKEVGHISYNTKWLANNGPVGSPSPPRPPVKRYDISDLIKAVLFCWICFMIDDWLQSGFLEMFGCCWLLVVLSIIFVDQPINDQTGAFEYIQDKK